MKKTSKSETCAFFQNGLGNYVMLTPSIVALSRHFNSTVDLVLNADWKDSRKAQIIDIAERWDKIGQVFQARAVTTQTSWLQLVPEGHLKKDDYKALYASGHNTGSPIMEWFGFFGNRWQRASWRRTRIHETEFHAGEVFRLGYRGPIPDAEIPLADGPDLGPKKGMRIAVCNGSARSDTYMWEKKRWWGFPYLADLMSMHYGAEIVVVGRGQDDEEFAGRVRKLLGGRCRDFVGRKLMITETARVLTQCDFVVSSDTAVAHVAAAAGVPVFVIFGPTLISKNKPWGRDVGVMKSPVVCSPCQYHWKFMACVSEEFKDPYGQRQKAWKCMRHIYVDRAMRMVRDFWRGVERRRAAGRLPVNYEGVSLDI